MANLKEYYVDSASGSNGNAGTSAGAAWATLAHACSNVTLGANAGTRLNCKGSFTENISSLAISPTNSQQLFIQGYSSTAGDGGTFSVDGSGSPIWAFGSAKNYITWIDMILSNPGTSHFITVASAGNWKFLRTKFVGADTVSYAVSGIAGTISFVSCWFDELTKGVWTSGYGSDMFIGNYLSLGASSTGNEAVIDFPVVADNVVVIKRTSNSIYKAATIGRIVLGNTIYSSSGVGCTGISIPNVDGIRIVQDNYIEGFSGTNGRAIWQSNTGAGVIIRGNAYYNCASGLVDDSGHNGWLTKESPTLLAASGLTNAGSGDYRPISSLRLQGWKETYNSAISPLGDAPPIGALDVEPLVYIPRLRRIK